MIIANATVYRGQNFDFATLHGNCIYGNVTFIWRDFWFYLFVKNPDIL